MSDIKRLVMRKSKLVLETFGKFDNTHQIRYTHNTGLIHVKKKDHVLLAYPGSTSC